MKNKKIKEELLNKLKRAGILHKEESMSRTGAKLDFYIDFKKVSGDPVLLEEVATCMLGLISNEVTSIVAEGHGGIPLAVLISQKLKKPLSLVRHKKRQHGTKKMIDGYLPRKNDKVLIIDDVLRTGSSIKESKEVLNSETDCKVVQAIVVVNRGEPVLKLDFPVNYLFDVEELFNSSY